MGFWAVPLAARMWLAVSSPSARSSTHCALWNDRHSCVKRAAVEDVCESHTYLVAGKQKLQISRCFLAFGSDTGLLVPYMDLSF